MMENRPTGTEQSQPGRRHDMTRRQAAIAHKHVAALSGLKVYPGHLPLDGQCLDELTHMGLIRPTRHGYALTPRGHETLDAEVASARLRQRVHQDA
jgi:hypothetical protein